MRVVSYARSFLGVLYLWGGNSPKGWDCSGFVQELLAMCGIDPVGDQTAQSLYNHFLTHGEVVSFDDSPYEFAGALVFYGRTKSTISHVAMMTSNYTIIEAGGGDSTCVDAETSARKGAFVRERPISIRKDIQSIIMPNFPDWVKDVS